MPLYESQLIGGFLFEAGVVAGRLSATRKRALPPTAVNLLQQTPKDGAFGDLVMGSQRCLLLEFKRTRSQVSNEKSKWDPLQLDKFLEDPSLVDLSERAHLLAYGDQSTSAVSIRLCHYVDAIRLEALKELDSCSANGLLKHLYDESQRQRPSFGVRPKEFFTYLNRLYGLRDRRSGSGDQDARGGPWLSVFVSRDGVLYHAAETLEQLLGLDQVLAHEVAPKQEKDRGYTP